MRKLILICLLILLTSTISPADIVTLESRWLKAEINDVTGRWSLLDKRSGTRWPSDGTAGPGSAEWLEGDFERTDITNKNTVHLHNRKNGTAVVFALVDEGKTGFVVKSNSPDTIADGVKIYLNSRSKTDFTIHIKERNRKNSFNQLPEVFNKILEASK